jgi:hypothetical protein
MLPVFTRNVIISEKWMNEEEGVMKTTTNFRFATAIFLAFVLILTQLSCGTSTTNILASSVPPTAESEQQTLTSPTQEQPINSQPTKPQDPTETIKPTDIPPTPTPQPEPITLLNQGFGQDKQKLGYSFIVENPNKGYAFESSQYQVAVYDAGGTVLKTDSSYIELLLPGQKMGIGGTIFLDEGASASKIEVQLNAGNAEATDLSTSFTVDKVSYRSSDFLSSVVGIITNPYNRAMENIRVSAVVYNDKDEIIGGGFTYVNFVLANGKIGVNVPVDSAGKVAKVELYPTISGLSMLTSSEELPEGAQNLNLEKQGYGQNGRQVGYGMLIQNPNGNFAVESTMYHITLYTQDGNVASVEEGYVDTILPNQTLGIGGDIYVEQGIDVASADFQIKTGRLEDSDAIPTFTSQNISYKADQYFPKVTGEIVSPYTKDITNLRVSAIAYNDAGDIIGGGFTFLEFAPANGKAAVEVGITTTKKPAKVELYAAISALSDIE